MIGIMAFIRPGFWELVIILLIVLLLFGATKLPQIGKSVGEAIKSFKKSVKDETEKDRETRPKE